MSALWNRGDRAPRLLALALLAIATYAVFAHGAIRSPAEPRVQVALELVAAMALAAGLWSGSLRLTAPPAALAAAMLLGLFAVWNAVGVAWSVAPDATWLEFNRAVSYVLVLCLAIVVGASLPRAVETVSAGFLALVVLVTVYGLAQKLLPGLSLFGLIDLNQTGRFARLQEPIGYWNALALLLAMGAPVALSVAGRGAVSPRIRLAALVSLELILLAGAFTISRGGTVAVIVALGGFLLLSGSALRLSMWLGAAVLAALPSLALGLSSHALSADHVPLARRESAGLLLLVVLVGCTVVLVLGAERLLVLEPALEPSASLRRRLRNVLLVGAAGLVIAAVLAVALSARGLTGTISHAWATFTTTQASSVSNPSRLLSTDSTYRWDWWREAVGAFSDRPLTGWGGGSFAVVHLLFRHNDLPVTHAHSVPLEWLAETGTVGLLLALAAWGLLLRTGARALRRSPVASERLIAAAALAAAIAYALHALYDWDWDIPGVTVPALILLGALTGSLAPRRQPTRPPAPSSALRLAGMVAATLGLCVLALSSVLPGLAASRASAALVTAAGPEAGGLLSAQREAASAASLDPLSDAGPLAEATIAIHRRELSAGRAYLLEAVNREPTDGSAWFQLAVVDIDLGRYSEALGAANRVFELDPLGATSAQSAVRLAQAAELRLAPPRSSATAAATPAQGLSTPASSSTATTTPPTSSASPSSASNVSPATSAPAAGASAP